jgi:hypothetical protein
LAYGPRLWRAKSGSARSASASLSRAFLVDREAGSRPERDFSDWPLEEGSRDERVSPASVWEPGRGDMDTPVSPVPPF